jgi:hypothetical protein
MRHLSYTNVTATIALFVALGGTSYAAATLSGADVRNGSVTGADLKSESVKGRDVDNGTLTGSDIRSGSLTASDVESLTAADLKAGQLAAGPPGPPGTTQVLTRRVAGVALAQGDNKEVVASCLPGEVAVGGGGFHDAPNDKAVVIGYTHPLEADGSTPEDGDRPTQWLVAGRNSIVFGADSTVTAYVLCANP